MRGELDATGTLTSRFIYGARQHVPDYVAREGVKLQLLTDARGSVRLVVDVASGQVVQRLDYDAWGNVLRDTSPGLQPFGFAGGSWDADTRLVRFGARDYDAETGRWTAKDPIGFSGGQANLYGYVGNDPINAIDPSGLVVETLWDAYSLAAGITSLLENLGCGNYGEAGVDAVGVAFDAFAAAIPVLPGGVGALRQAARGAGAASNVLLRTGSQLASKFKHAKDFGVVGNYSKANAGQFSRAIHQHINSPAVRAIEGTYHKAPVTHDLDPSSGLNVLADSAGNFISGWKLSPAQLQNVLTHGGL